MLRMVPGVPNHKNVVVMAGKGKIPDVKQLRIKMNFTETYSVVEQNKTSISQLKKINSCRF
jgi:hypothetical protein